MPVELFKDVAAQAEHDRFPGQHYHYARVVFDWAAPHCEIAAACQPEKRHFARAVGAAAVYAIGPELGDHTKIGIAADPFDRLSCLQTGSWERLQIYRLLWVYEGAAYSVEQAALELARMRDVEVRGEWVGVPADGAFRLVLAAAAALGVQAGNKEAMDETFTDMNAGRMQSMRKLDNAEKVQKFARMGY